MQRDIFRIPNKNSIANLNGLKDIQCSALVVTLFDFPWCNKTLITMKARLIKQIDHKLHMMILILPNLTIRGESRMRAGQGI